MWDLIIDPFVYQHKPRLQCKKAYPRSLSREQNGRDGTRSTEPQYWGEFFVVQQLVLPQSQPEDMSQIFWIYIYVGAYESVHCICMCTCVWVYLGVCACVLNWCMYMACQICQSLSQVDTGVHIITVIVCAVIVHEGLCGMYILWISLYM